MHARSISLPALRPGSSRRPFHIHATGFPPSRERRCEDRGASQDLVTVEPSSPPNSATITKSAAPVAQIRIGMTTYLNDSSPGSVISALEFESPTDTVTCSVLRLLSTSSR